TAASTASGSRSCRSSRLPSTAAWPSRRRAASSSCFRPTPPCSRCAGGSPSGGTWPSTGGARRERVGAGGRPSGSRGAAAARSGGGSVRIRVGHLYPDRLNIYADRGNIAVLSARAAARGHELDVRPVGIDDPVPQADLFYIGGGQDREQALVAPD